MKMVEVMQETEGIFRTERDSIGTCPVPANALYGVQTQRALENFKISGTTLGRHAEIIRALAMVKRAAAVTNKTLGVLPENLCDAIVAACDELIAGQHHDAFALDVFQGGAGTSTNMNANEVIANLALRHMGKPLGDYDTVNPNDHVNLSQSTNDAYATAARLSVLLSHEPLMSVLEELATAFDRKAEEFNSIVKLGRTQMQDAVPMTLGQEFHAFAVTIREDIKYSRKIVGMFCEVNLGGTAIGTGLNAPAGYAQMVVDELAKVSGQPIVLAEDLIEATWDMGGFVLYSGMLKRTATKLSKICNDLRLLSSGPRGGFGEIRLPPMQPGSSIMPGKVNPVIPEVVSQVCFQVIGYDVAVSFAAEAGQLQLNAMEPLIVHNVHMSAELLTTAVRTLTEKCIRGIEADPDYCRKHVEMSTSLATALSPYLGYAHAAEVAKAALASGKTVREVAREQGILPEEDIDRLLDPARMAVLHR